MSDDDLPVIVVSAKDEEAANQVISDLIEIEEESGSEGYRVWRLNNKYYTARVRLLALGDGQPAPAQAEAHVVLLAEGEGAAELAARSQVVQALSPGVCVSLCSGRVSGAVRVCAAAAHYEPLSLAPEEGEPPPTGLQRAREALHAHTWPTLHMHHDAYRPPLMLLHEAASSSGGSGGSGGEWEETAEGAEVVRRCEAFAEALGALSLARAAPPHETQQAAAARRARAERLLQAFAAALHTDLDDL